LIGQLKQLVNQVCLTVDSLPCIEAAHFGISVQLLEPGAVSSGGAERAKVLLDDGNPYRPLPATSLLAARKAAPEDVPFLAAPLDW